MDMGQKAKSAIRVGQKPRRRDLLSAMSPDESERRMLSTRGDHGAEARHYELDVENVALAVAAK